MAITILDYVNAAIGDQAEYAPEDFYRSGVDMLGGCQYCHATIAAWNAYPSKSGYWRCGDCIGDIGYATIRELTNQVMNDYQCPGCGAPGHLSEQFAVGEACAFACRHCGRTWTIQA